MSELGRVFYGQGENLGLGFHPLAAGRQQHKAVRDGAVRSGEQAVRDVHWHSTLVARRVLPLSAE